MLFEIFYAFLFHIFLMFSSCFYVPFIFFISSQFHFQFCVKLNLTYIILILQENKFKFYILREKVNVSCDLHAKLLLCSDFKASQRHSKSWPINNTDSLEITYKIHFFLTRTHKFGILIKFWGYNNLLLIPSLRAII